MTNISTNMINNYWLECISQAADECQLNATPEQIGCLVDAVCGGHENIGMAFYSPPASDRIDSVIGEWQSKLQRLQAEFDAYRNDAETAIRMALRQRPDAAVSIHPDGEVLRHGGRTERIQ